MRAFQQGILWVLALVAVGYGQSVSVEITAPPPLQTPPDRFVTAVFQVRNGSASEETYIPTVDAPQGWTLISQLSPLTLKSGEQLPLFVTVFVPASTAADGYALTLRVTSQREPAVQAEANVLISILPVVRIEILAPEGQATQPGTSLEYVFTLVNQGNIADLVHLSAESSRGFPLKLEREQQALLSGERALIRVSLTIPLDAHEGSDKLTLHASSMHQEGAEAEANVLTAVLPPGPEAVRGSLSLEIPVQAALKLNPLGKSGSAGKLDLQTDVLIEQLRLDFDLSFEYPDLFPPKLVEVTAQGLPPGFLGVTLRKTPQTATGEFALSFHGGSLRATLERLDSDRHRGALRFDLSEFSPLSATAVAEIVEDSGQIDQGLQLELLGKLVEFDSSFAALQARLYRFGPNFTGSGGRDSQGGSIALRAEFEPLTFLTSHEMSEHALSTTCPFSRRLSRVLGSFSSDVLGLLITEWSLFEEGDLPGCAAGPPFSYQRREDLQVEWSHQIGSLAFTFGAHHGNLIAISPKEITEFETTGFHVSARGAFPPLFPSVSVKRDLTLSKLTGEIVDAPIAFDLSLQFQQGLFGASVTFFLEEKRVGVRTDLSASLPGLTASLTSSMQTETFTGEATLSLGIGLSADLIVPTHIPVKGSIEGFVFLDRDRDRQQDPDEPGLKNLILRLGDRRVSTDENGRYRFPPLPPGTYELDIDKLPVGLTPLVPLPQQVTIEAGKIERRNLPLAQGALVVGSVFLDLDRNGQRAASEQGLARVRLALQHLPSGVMVNETLTNTRGQFAFVDVAPGTYRVLLRIDSLPPRFEATTPIEQAIRVQEGDRVSLEFGAAEKPRPVIIQKLPIPDFVFSPSQPKPGEMVTFDASASRDPDGQITRYEWDFNADGKSDAFEVQAKFTFAHPGDYAVTLKVIDNDGNSASIRKTVPVR
ncbi:MAG: hypothetical protein A2Z21_03860 [Candidatus Fraserbacteria bacterium RBG_16_55_9]|uniref:PKD domain-containing protein n=1 Tax=Fraserbacteria sp. (strain RBG_16_55_9) TaxID=1817864 RepID=A0A1F5UXB9_FRAXR|nr:MAG: hypothetical protein A2Z21_03860 [Candidatus Fraserbacteria bacterium RBG_16_55_9]